MTRRQRFPFSWIQTVGIIIRKLHSHIVLFNGIMHSDWIFESLVLYTKSNNGKQVFQKTRETKRTRKWNWASITCTDCRGKNNNHFSSYQSLSQYACLNHFSSHQSLSQYACLKVLSHLHVFVCWLCSFSSLFIRSITAQAKWRWSLGQHGRASGGKCVCWCHTCGPGEVCGCRRCWFCVSGCWPLSGSSMCLYPFTAGI